MAFYEKEIGVPFPWDKYDQVTCADYHWGGMENTTITTLTQRTINSDDVENVRSSRSLDAHEMAHQWFGDYVTCKDWSHLWLNEGFATYYALLHERHQFGQDAFNYGLYLDARDDIFVQDKDERPIVYREYKDPGEQFDFRNYPKASWVLHMLRSLVGEDLYREAIRNYLKRHALSDVETEDLREAFEEVSGRPLDKFFDQWVYHGGLPKLKVTYRWLAEDRQAHVTVEQTQETNGKVLLFELETKLRFVVDGKPIDEPIKIDGRRHDFYVSLPEKPEIVRFDPGAAEKQGRRDWPRAGVRRVGGAKVQG
jgi:aminopeptidase N